MAFTPLRLPFSFALAFLLAVAGASSMEAQSSVAPTDVRSADYLDSFIGTYNRSAAERFVITREGDELQADAGNGRPTARLVPQREPGVFLMRDADFTFRFLTDRAGNLTTLDVIDPRGITRRLQRANDTRVTAESVRAVAVNSTTSVLARVFNGYQRRKAPDGRDLVETYAFGEGGFQAGSPVADASIDGMTFDTLAQLIAPAMRAQGYQPSTDPDATDLVVMIYWGTTTTDEHPAVIAEETYNPLSHVNRGKINRVNARLLGFEEAVEKLPEVPGSKAASRRADLFDDLEESRYWVALIAIDYRSAQQDKKARPLWSVRYNIRSRGTTFDEALPQMSNFASRYFGRDSGGLINPATKMPDGEVEIGDLKVVDPD